MQRPMQSKASSPPTLLLKPARQTGAGRPESQSGASLHTNIQPPSSGVVRGKADSEKKKKKGKRSSMIEEQMR